MDEFHESESWEYRVREMFKAIGGTCRWGLSGTPPVGNLASIQDVAAILWYKEPLVGQTDAQRFLDEYVRQNSSAVVDAIRVVTHLQHVTPTREERILYRQACHDHDIFDLEAGYDGVSLESRAALLKRCAHFNLDAHSDSAGAEVERLGDAKRHRIGHLKDQLYLEAARACELNAWPAFATAIRHASGAAHAGARGIVEEILAQAAEALARGTSPFVDYLARAIQIDIEIYDRNGELRVEPRVGLRQPIRETEYYTDDRQRHAVVHWVARRANTDAHARLRRMEICARTCSGQVSVSAAIVSGATTLVGLLDTAQRSLQFWDKQLQSVGSLASAEDRACSICLEDNCSLDSLCILPCAHIFHASCVRAVLGVSANCPQCRQPVRARNISSLKLELRPEEEAMDAVPTDPEILLTPEQRAHGSKLCAVARTLCRIREEDATAKAIVFVQWADLEVKVARALRAHNLEVLCLPTPGAAVKNSGAEVLKMFQEDTSSPNVLILSLEHAASGANLTAASHVLFVHPMNAETVQTAVAWERQAIGRIRRIGQTRPEIVVHRFVTRGTVEEHITNIHQQHA